MQVRWGAVRRRWWLCLPRSWGTSSSIVGCSSRQQRPPPPHYLRQLSVP